MRIERAFFHSRLGRRIFWLFVVCALVPISILAGISLWNVSGQVEEQSRRNLHQASHEEGMQVYERLLFLESAMRLTAAGIEDGIVQSAPRRQDVMHLEQRFKGIEVLKPGQPPRILFGNISGSVQPDQLQLAHLATGRPVVATEVCGAHSTCIWMILALDPQDLKKGLLAGELLPRYLWQEEDAADQITLCVLDDSKRQLFASSVIPPDIASHVTSASTGNFAWNYLGKENEADYWNIFLKPNFNTDHWTVIASEARQDMLAPMAQFKKIFPLVVLLSFWIVLLLSLVQIRRNLIPLGKLKEGTRDIAAGNFQSRVKVQSGDEFEDLAQSFNSMAGRINRQFESLKIKNEIDRAILSFWEVEKIADGLLARLSSLLPYEYASMSLIDPRMPTHALTYVKSAQPGGPQEIRTIELTEGECSSLKDNPEIKILSLNDDYPDCLIPLATRGMHSFCVVPIVVRGRLAAILSLGQSGTKTWSEEDKLEARHLADQLGVALSNASLVAELKNLHWGTLTALGRAVDVKSHWTSGHSARVTDTALKLGHEMGLTPNELEILHRGSLLHDVGKIGIPSYILDKPGALTESEMETVRQHVNIGLRILEPIPGFEDCLPLVAQHHEWFNGQGYPNKLSGEQISLYARIFSVADSFDALISPRPYRGAIPLPEVLKIIQSESGVKHDPRIVEALLRIVGRENSSKARPGDVGEPAAVSS